MKKVKGLISRTVSLIIQFQDIFKDKKKIPGNSRTSWTSGHPDILYLSVVDAAQLTGWVKPGEIWQLNFWIWILQAEENYLRIQYSMKTWTTFCSFYLGRFLCSLVFAHSRFISAYYFLAFLILIFYGIGFRI